VLVAGFVVAASPVAGALPATGKPDMPEEVLAKARSEYPDVPVDVLYQRMSLTLARKRLLADYAVRYAATFGGSWYDFRTGEWNLLATNRAAAEAMAAPARAAGIAVRTRIVRYSAARLHARADAIRGGRDPLSKVSREAGVDVMANDITVGAARAGSTDPMVEFVAPATKQGPDDACTDRRNCGVPLRTGLEIWRVSEATGPSCSLGFVASATDGTRWVVTAGHCVHHIDELWGHGEQVFGPVRQCALPASNPLPTGCLRSSAGDVDAARIKITSSYWLSNTFGWIFYNPTTYVPVDGAITAKSQIELNDFVCLSGWHSSSATGWPSNTDNGRVNQDTCGPVTSVSASNHEGMPVASASSCPGDSGGGWLFYPGGGERWAYGIDRNGTEDPDDFCSSGFEVWFSSIPAINAFFDANSAATVRVITR
jgi:streptogrisin C